MSNDDMVLLDKPGPGGCVVAAKLPDESCPAFEFLQNLPVNAQTQFKARFERLSATGRLISPDQLRKLEQKGEPIVWEIKVHSGPGWRLYVVPVQLMWVATHGTKKPKDKQVSREIKRAREIFEGWRG